MALVASLASVLVLAGAQAEDMADRSSQGFLSKYLPAAMQRAGGKHGGVGSSAMADRSATTFHSQGTSPAVGTKDFDPLKIAGDEEEKSVHKMLNNSSIMPIPVSLAAVGVGLVSLAAMLLVRMQRGLQSATIVTSSGGLGSDMSVAMAPASGDNLLELETPGSSINGAAVLETKISRKENFRRASWGQMSSKNLQPLTLCHVTAVKEEELSRFITGHPNNNITPYIANLVGRDLHKRTNHPLEIIKGRIEKYFAGLETEYEVFDGEDPIVTTTQCFDDLNIPPEHPGRSKSDTYYINDETLLRTHTSAHQSEHLRAGHEAFLCTGDVYRRDEIDASHFPAFHQMEGVKLFPTADLGGETDFSDVDKWLKSDNCAMIAADLKQTLEGMIRAVFDDPDLETRWRDDYFPFTEPSFELDVFYQGEWLEVLGSGVIHSDVLGRCGLAHRRGWAFGLGLERLAMVLFSIPDIRLFWTDDERFHKQFQSGDVVTFKPYSKYPPVFKDIAFWCPEAYEENDFNELARSVAGELVERVENIDTFTNPKTGKTSNCYRITYRSMDRSLTDVEINALQDNLRDQAASKLQVELR